MADVNWEALYNKGVKERQALWDALEQIGALWPEWPEKTPDCPGILNVTNVNEGKARAVLLDTALAIARDAIKKLRSS